MFTTPKHRIPITPRAESCIREAISYGRGVKPSERKARNWNIRLLEEYLEYGNLSLENTKRALSSIKHLKAMGKTK